MRQRELQKQNISDDLATYKKKLSGKFQAIVKTFPLKSSTVIQWKTKITKKGSLIKTKAKGFQTLFRVDFKKKASRKHTKLKTSKVIEKRNNHARKKYHSASIIYSSRSTLPRNLRIKKEEKHYHMSKLSINLT